MSLTDIDRRRFGGNPDGIRVDLPGIPLDITSRHVKMSSCLEIAGSPGRCAFPSVLPFLNYYLSDYISLTRNSRLNKITALTPIQKFWIPRYLVKRRDFALWVPHTVDRFQD